MSKSPEEMEAAMLKNLEEKTGKTLSYWLKTAKTAKCAKHGELVKFLKSEHGITHGYANLIAHKSLKPDNQAPPTGNELVDTQYEGPKAALKPIYAKLIKAVTRFGKDVDVSPKKSYVSLRRSKQFALIQPSTKTRVDVGIQVKGMEPTTRLEPSGKFNEMVSHRVRVTDESQVDKELVGWLKKAYDAS